MYNQVVNNSNTKVVGYITGADVNKVVAIIDLHNYVYFTNVSVDVLKNTYCPFS